MHLRFQQVRRLEAHPTAPQGEARSLDSQLIEVIRAPLHEGESRVAGHDRKGHEIGRLFATLSAIDAWNLHRRLADPQPGDALATAFGRLIQERRTRLLALLGCPKRRASLGR